MSHAIDFDALDEKLFVLQHLVLASSSYCEQRGIGTESDEGDGAKDEYWGWVKALTSNYLLECAVKTRVFHDFLTASRFEHELKKLDAEAREGLTIGVARKGSFPATLRETCNKIIHATHVILVWNEESKHHYWSGKMLLTGAKGTEEWELELHVGQWARAMARYHESLSQSEGRIYAGQDW